MTTPANPGETSKQYSLIIFPMIATGLSLLAAHFSIENERARGALAFLTTGGFLVWLVLWTRYWYLPPTLKQLAKRFRLVCTVSQLYWRPMEISNQFAFAFIGKTNHRMENFTDENAEIVEGDQRRDLNTFTGFLHWFYNWLYDTFKLFWIGFNSPSIVKPGSLEIEIWHKIKSLQDDVPVEKCIEKEMRWVTELQMESQMFIPVTEANLQGNDQSNYLVLIGYTSKRPRRLWYGFGRKSYQQLQTKIRSFVNDIAENHTAMDILIRDRNFAEPDEAEEKKARAKHKDIVEEDLRRIIKERADEFLVEYGIVITSVDLDSWSVQLSEKTKADLQEIISIERKKRIEILDARKSAAVAEEQVKAAPKLIEAATAQTNVNAEKAKAIIATAGGNPAIADEALVFNALGRDGYAIDSNRRWRSATGISTLVEGGASANVLVSPTPPAKEQPADDKTKSKKEAK